MFTINRRDTIKRVSIQTKYGLVLLYNINILCIIYNVSISPLAIGFTCHLSSYSFHILVMTFTVETVVDWPVFRSAVRIFVSATEGHTVVLIHGLFQVV